MQLKVKRLFGYILFSFTDLIPDYREANVDKIITKLNLKILN